MIKKTQYTQQEIILKIRVTLRFCHVDKLRVTRTLLTTPLQMRTCQTGTKAAKNYDFLTPIVI